jgi:hypothetical protein
MLAAKWTFNIVAIGKYFPQEEVPRCALEHAKHLVVYRHVSDRELVNWPTSLFSKLVSLRCEPSSLLSYWSNLHSLIIRNPFLMTHFTLTLDKETISSRGFTSFELVMEKLGNTIHSLCLRLRDLNTDTTRAIETIKLRYLVLKSLQIDGLNRQDAAYIFKGSWSCLECLRCITFSRCTLEYPMLIDFIRRASILQDIRLVSSAIVEVPEGVDLSNLEPLSTVPVLLSRSAILGPEIPDLLAVRK